MSRSTLPVFGLALIGVAFAGMGLAMKYGASEIAHAATLLAGFLFAAASSAFSTYIRSFDRASTASVSFDEMRARHSIDGIIDGGVFQNSPPEQSPPWDVRGDILVGQDRHLALAKLRIDLERELRRRAFIRGIQIASRSLSIGRLLDELKKHDALDSRVISAIRDILPVCNAAIHGGDVSQSVAIAVLALGQDVLRLISTNEREFGAA